MGHWQNRTHRCSGSGVQFPEELRSRRLDHFESERKLHQQQAFGLGQTKILLILFALLNAPEALLHWENPIAYLFLPPWGVHFAREKCDTCWPLLLLTRFLLSAPYPLVHPSLIHYCKYPQPLWQQDSKNVPSTAYAWMFIEARRDAPVQVAKRSKLRSCIVIPQRPIAERSFARLEKCCRLQKKCEYNLNTSLQVMHLVLLVLLLRRLWTGRNRHQPG